MRRWPATRRLRNFPRSGSRLQNGASGPKAGSPVFFWPSSILHALAGFLLGLLLLSTTAGTADAKDDAYLAELISRSSEARLSEQRYWHLLLHYREDFGGGYTSEADDPGFFLAPTGKTDPRAELEATLARFFSDELVGRSRQPAQCAFIARYHWLKSRLAIDDQRLPPLPCDRFKAWYAELNPQSVSYIFAAAFMNNPSSMFGHTFLRIDQKGQTEQTRLLAYTINYAADVTTDSGVAFAFLGITGGFKGYFSTMPYYLKVQEYRDFENRDIWEYRLNLTEAQVERMLQHAWELGNAYFDYYFFKENCSYHLLSLLEIADPELHLADQFVFWTVPADTVKLVTRQTGLVETVTYRPSRSTQIRRKRETLTDEEQQWLHRIIADPAAAHATEFTGLPLQRRTLILDVASDYLLYRSATDGAHAASYKEKTRNVLTARSGLKVPSEELAVRPFAQRPELGHLTSRAGVGAGWRQDEWFEELNIRTGYHDLLDPETGYTPGAQIELLALSLRHYEKRDRTRLERATLVNILSLSPSDALFQAPSWKLNAGYETVNRPGCRYCGNANLNVGIGPSFETHWLRREVFFAFAEADANYSHAFERNHRIGGGGTVGMLADLTERWRVLVSGTYLGFPLGENSDELRASVQQRYTLRKDLALRLEFNHRPHDNDAVLSIQVYF
ncbi:MAG: DUF4105 domain-containing protein [Nitrospirae bacterium]|nr:MAG: DUF4105 domain-containing protein [Nitrospirota bacterium]